MKIGSDPEFIILDSIDKTVVSASLILQDDHLRRKIGHDGNFWIGELRPTAREDPIRHFNDILRLLTKEARKRIPVSIERNNEHHPIILRAGSTGGLGTKHNIALGGHIHFEEVGYYFVKQANNYLSVPLLFIEEYPYNSYRRGCLHYGYLGDYRVKRWRTSRIEYRTPSSWLVDPLITKAVICLAFVIYKEYLETGGQYKDYLASLGYLRGPSDFSSSNLKTFQNILPNILEDIRSFSSYHEYREHIDIIFLMIKKNRVWDEMVDIRNRWERYEELQKEYENNPDYFVESNYRKRRWI